MQDRHASRAWFPAQRSKLFVSAKLPCLQQNFDFSKPFERFISLIAVQIYGLFFGLCKSFFAQNMHPDFPHSVENNRISLPCQSVFCDSMLRISSEKSSQGC